MKLAPNPKPPTRRGKNAASQEVTRETTRLDKNGNPVTTRETTKPVKEDDFVPTGFTRDTFDMEQLRKISERVAAVLGQDPEIQALFAKAFSEGYSGPNGKTQFWNDLKATKFWQTQAADLREYVVLSADPTNPDFKVKQEQAREVVRARAKDLGVTVTEQDLATIGEEYLMGGWGKAENDFKLRNRLSGMLAGGATGGGVYDEMRDALFATARANGVSFDDRWFDSAAKSIASDATDLRFWDTKIREQAASKFPVFADQIRAGVDMDAIASPYMKMIQEYWEVPVDQISLDNPDLLRGLTGYDDKGNPRAMNLGDYAQMLRDDPRYMATSKAKNEVASTAHQVLQMFGIIGGAR